MDLDELERLLPRREWNEAEVPPVDLSEVLLRTPGRAESVVSRPLRRDEASEF